MTNFKAKIIILITGIAVLSCTVEVKAWYYDSIDKAGFQGYKGEGSFVEGPAYTGSAFGYVLMTSPPFFPAQALSEPTRLIYNNDLQNISDYIGAYVMIGSAKFFGVLFGGPSYGFKKAFWDLPGYAINGQWPDNSPKKEDIILNPKLIGEHDVPASATLVETTPVQPVEEKKVEQKKPETTSAVSKPEIPAEAVKPAEKQEKKPAEAQPAPQPVIPQETTPAPTPAVDPFAQQPSSWSSPSVSTMMKNTETDTK